ncbi:Peptidyl-prolyl cis-trans isomerase [Claviceps africana]|uniref:peptidylprolyl isomerase n=1 Tax=Claviceps africana TaxID=83212 RepID=A0A8K0NJZ3_9HYPO|nr:Peptidyl-prolyl cis-trans isomerase [Claviceps africana]
MKSAALLSALAVAVGVVATEELKIDVTHSVECDRKTQKGDRVSMHYRGTLQESGKQFDASYDRGQPLTFALGTGQVIRGWDEGLTEMCIGEKRTLTIPPELAYGERGIGPIPPGSTLVFETELVGIEGVAKPEKEKGKEQVAQKVGEKVADAVRKATEAAKTLAADTDDAQSHEEL